MTPQTEFTVSDVKYRCGKMDAVTQAHVYRRLLPLLDAVRVVTRGRKPGDVATPVAPELAQEALGVATRAIGDMPDEQFNYVIRACLETVERQDGTVWAPVYNAATSRVMYDDVTLIPLIMICFNVLKGSIGPFSLGSLTSSVGPLRAA